LENTRNTYILWKDRKHHSAYKSHAIFSQFSLTLNNFIQSIFSRTGKRILAFYPSDKRQNKYSYREHSYNFESGFDNSGVNRERTSYNVNSENFTFQNRRKVQQEVEQIREIVVETTKTLNKSPSSNYPAEAEIKRHIDINRISDQVYQNIERRIKIERERRGI
jgi:hypothetical protein